MRRLMLALLGSVSSIALAQAQGASPSPETVPAIQPGAPSSVMTVTGSRWVARTTPPPRQTQEQAAATAEREKLQDSVPTQMPPQVPLLSPDRPLTRNGATAVSVANRWANRPMRPRVGPDGAVHIPYGRAEPVVVCAVLHWCDIALQPGEVVPAPANIGDERWLSHLVFSGTGAQRITHVVVKPSDAGLDANLLLYTNMRVYSIRLLSTARRYMPLTTFDIVDQPSNLVGGHVPLGGAVYGGSYGDPCDQVPALPENTFNIGKGDALWRPSRVYAVMTAVGMKTCVQFPVGVASTRLPVVVAVTERGGWFSSDKYQAVNVRYDPVRLRYTIEGLVRNFDLVQGVADSSQRVKVSTP